MKSALDGSAAGEIRTWDQRLHSGRDTLDFQIGASSSAQNRPNFLFDLHRHTKTTMITIRQSPTAQLGLFMDLSYNLHPHILSIVVSHTIIPAESSRPKSRCTTEQTSSWGFAILPSLACKSSLFRVAEISPFSNDSCNCCKDDHCRRRHHDLHPWLLSNCLSAVWNVCGV